MNLKQFIRGNPKLLRLVRYLQRWLRPLYAQPITDWFEYIRFFNDWQHYRAAGEVARIKDFYACLTDQTHETPFDAYYFYQGAWLARRVGAAKMAKHVDIASSALTISALSAQVETVFVDYRPLKASLPGLTSIAGDILNLLFSDDSIESLSCLHVIEHIGFGRL